MKIDIIKVIDEVDRHLFKRMDLLEDHIKSIGATCLILNTLTTTYMLVNMHYLKKKNAKLKEEIEGLKNAKGE